MSSTIHNQIALGKLGSTVFARQMQIHGAGRHASLLAGLRAWRARRKARAELYRLSDRSLADIGLTRADIPYVVAAGRQSDF